MRHSADCQQPNTEAPGSGKAALVVNNRGGIAGLLKRLDSVVQVELVSFDEPQSCIRVDKTTRTQLLTLLKQGGVADSRAVALPPWPAAFVLVTAAGERYALQLVGDGRTTEKEYLIHPNPFPAPRPSPEH